MAEREPSAGETLSPEGNETVAKTEMPTEERSFTEEELVQGIPALRRFLDSLPLDHPGRPDYTVDLAMRLGIKFSACRTKPDMADIFEAIHLAHEAIDSIPLDDPRRARWTGGFEHLLGDRFSAARELPVSDDDPLDDAPYIADCGPGELGSLPPVPRRPLGCGLQNLPYDDDGNLNFIDIMSGDYDSNGRWSYRPIQRGIFTGGFRALDVGTYDYAPGDFIYNDDNGERHIIVPMKLNWVIIGGSSGLTLGFTWKIRFRNACSMEAISGKLSCNRLLNRNSVTSAEPLT